MTNQPSSSSNFGTSIIIAIIGAFAIIFAALLGQEGFFQLFRSKYLSKTVSIAADSLYSGASAGGDLLTFTQYNNITGLGDTDTDQPVKSFFSFYLGDIPIKSEILEARLRINCRILGNPEGIGGNLRLVEFPYGTYDISDFWNIPASPAWYKSWTNNATLFSPCNDSGFFKISGNTLTELVQQRIVVEWVQFVFFFENQVAIANQSNDSIILNGPPVLEIRYLEGQ